MQENWIVPDWPAPARVHAIVTTREGPGQSDPPYARFNLGLRSGDDATVVAANRRALVQALGLPQSPRWLHQVHGTRVVAAEAMASDVEPEADAAVARDPGVVLVIQTADCLPVVLCADDGSEIAAAHAGWRGLAAGVLEATVGAMATPAARLVVWLGPCIGPGSFEVDAPVRDAFGGDRAPAGAFAATRPGHWHADLAWLARGRLASIGVPNVHGGGFDTVTDARFYSYRRDGARSGRFATLIWRD